MSYFFLIRYTEIGKEPHPEKSKAKRDIELNLKLKIHNVKLREDIGRIFIETAKDETETLNQIYGISSFSPCVKCSLDKLEETLANFAENILADKKSFGVKVKRVGQHPFSSQEKAGELGAIILNHFPHLIVDLKTPDEMLFVEIRDSECYIFNSIITGIDKHLASDKQIILEPKFIVDDMLGKLAVRLRMLGFDATYYGDSADSFLLRKSKEDGRILLTRDLSLTKISGANALFIKSRKLMEQLREVIEKFNLTISEQNLFSRCSICNTPLQPVPKERVKDKVPPLIYKLFDAFSYCPVDDKYYWKGTHYENMLNDLKPFLKS